MPAGLPPLAIEEWIRTLPDLEALGVLSKIDGKALAGYCSAYAHWMAAEAELERHGLIIEQPILDRRGKRIGTRRKTNPAFALAQQSLATMKSFLIEFGMTPAARTRIRIEKPKEVDPFDVFLKRGGTKGRVDSVQ